MNSFRTVHFYSVISHAKAFWISYLFSFNKSKKESPIISKNSFLAACSSKLHWTANPLSQLVDRSICDKAITPVFEKSGFITDDVKKTSLLLQKEGTNEV